MENQFKKTEMSPEQQKWVNEQDEISRREALTYVMESQVEAIEAQTKAIEAQTEMMLRFINVVDDLTSEVSTLNERFAPCDFTRWSITECLSNLSATLEQLNSK